MKTTLELTIKLILKMMKKDSLDVCRVHPSCLLGPQDYAYQWRIG